MNVLNVLVPGVSDGYQLLPQARRRSQVSRVNSAVIIVMRMVGRLETRTLRNITARFAAVVATLHFGTGCEQRKRSQCQDVRLLDAGRRSVILWPWWHNPSKHESCPANRDGGNEQFGA